MALKHCIFTFLMIIALVPQITSRIIPEASMRERHEEWMTRYGREYKDASEKEKRYEVFKTNVEYIDNINSDGGISYKLEVNQFADHTNEEFMATYKSYRNSNFKTKSKVTASFQYENFTAIPPSIDWRKEGAVTAIRDETCGAWTFPAVDSVEGITKIKSGILYTLSVQEILDCDSNDSNACSGGMVSDAFDFIKQNGLTTETNYPPKTEPGTCDKNKEAQPVAKISSYGSVPPNEEALIKAVANQPIAVSVDASGSGFQFYSSGVFTGQCGTALDHGVTVVGYGTENGKLKYWIIKNSWGTTWGEKGYMRLERNVNVGGGLCGIALEALYPVAEC